GVAPAPEGRRPAGRGTNRRRTAVARRALSDGRRPFPGGHRSEGSMLNTAVLVLNRNYQPVHVTNVKRAFSLLYMGVARAIDTQYRLYDFESWAALSAAEHEHISTVERAIRVPRVLVLMAYEYLPKGRVRFSRLNIYARDNDTCQYCGLQLTRADLNL